MPQVTRIKVTLGKQVIKADLAIRYNGVHLTHGLKKGTFTASDESLLADLKKKCFRWNYGDDGFERLKDAFARYEGEVQVEVLFDVRKIQRIKIKEIPSPPLPESQKFNVW